MIVLHAVGGLETTTGKRGRECVEAQRLLETLLDPFGEPGTAFLTVAANRLALARASSAVGALHASRIAAATARFLSRSSHGRDHSSNNARGSVERPPWERALHRLDEPQVFVTHGITHSDKAALDKVAENRSPALQLSLLPVHTLSAPGDHPPISRSPRTPPCS
jgi:hypothetical protein